MSTKLCSLAVVVVALGTLLQGLLASSAMAQDRPQACRDEEDKLTVELRSRVSADLNQLASELSVLVAQAEVRRLVATQITDAKHRSVGLHQVLEELGQQRDAQKFDAILTTIRKIEAAMADCSVAAPRLDIKLPVEAHVKAIAGASELYVAVVPLVDEDQVEKITAFSNGKRVELDPKTPPEVPTLVLVGAEPQADDPGYPLAEAKEPGTEENPREVDDYVGIPWIFISDDHESWLCGDPEIYVRVKRFRFSTFSIINEKVNLPGVNGEQVWYNLGDPNSTYKFVSTSDYAPVVRLEFWEEDSGFHGSDDFLGAINVTWTRLSFGGYQFFTAGDARFGVDRD